MTITEIQNLHSASLINLTLCCSRVHAHSALDGCYCGDRRDVAVCKLAEQLAKERAVVRENMLS